MLKKEKLPAGVTNEFVDELNTSNVDEVRLKIVAMQRDLAEAQTFLKENQEIVDLKDQLKLVQGPTQDTIKTLKNRTKYALEHLKDKGAL